MSGFLKQNVFEQAPNIKLLLNIGACLDIPTGVYIKGIHGENLLLGGLGLVTGFVGKGNSFKSTVAHYNMLSAADRLFSTAETSMSTYDTEVNIQEERLRHMSQAFDSFKNKDILNDGTWTITDKTIYYANEWHEKTKEFLKFKEANVKKITVKTPFLSRDQVTQLEIPLPTFGEVDSFSEFETSDVAKIQDENELGESGGNTIHMRQGLAKTRFLMEVPNLSGSINHFFILTAHMGTEINMATGPYAPPPAKKLQHMKQGDKIKGVTDKFFFLMSNCWETTKTALLVNQTTKSVEYPRRPGEEEAGDTDLNTVTLKLLRSKSGKSGALVDLVVSQTDGVLPSLTEFNLIKNEDRFGLSGTLQNYVLDLLPEVKLSRTTIRMKLDTIPALRRAVNITSEMCQISTTFRTVGEAIRTPKELYEDLKEQGYDWDFILNHTRSWWTVNNDDHPTLYYLSTMDLICMTNKIKQKLPHLYYFPYWMNEDKTVKAEYLKK